MIKTKTEISILEIDGEDTGLSRPWLRVESHSIKDYAVLCISCIDDHDAVKITIDIDELKVALENAGRR